jgi:HK97 family phage portal protein
MGIRNADSSEALLWSRVFPGEDMRSASGIRISERTALTVSDVLKCVRVRAESFAILPKKIYQRATILGRESREEARKHPLFHVIHDEPNPLHTSYVFFELMSQHLDTWGNFYAYIERGKNTGLIRALWPLQPHNVRIDIVNGQMLYYVTNVLEGGASIEKPFYPDEILHIKGLGYDGVVGYSPIRLQMDALGWAKATERYSARFFANSARPSGILSTEGPLSPEQKKDLKESFQAFHSGSENAARIALIEGNVTWSGLTLPQNEAQFLETRKFQRTDIAGMYRVPVFMIGDSDPVSDNNVEHMGIQATTWMVQPAAERCEQELDRQLLSPKEKGTFFFEFELKALMKGDLAARTSHYEKMVGNGMYCQNDALAEENMPPFQGGDTHWMPLNYAPIDQLVKMAAATQAAPDPAQAMKDSILAELQARFRSAYRSSFRDAIGRALPRKDRESSVPLLFRHLIVGLASGLNVSIDDNFRDDYLRALGKRSTEWTESTAERDADTEVNRAVKTIAERSQREEQIPA